MLRQTAQQATRIRKEKYVVTKEFPVATEIAKDSKKIMSRQTLKGQGHEKLDANKFGVATQVIPITTRTRLLK